jgi:hypothetical protein
MIANSVAGGSSMTAWTNSHRWWPLGRRRTGCLEEAGEVASSAGGRKSMAVDGDSCRRRRRRGEVGRLASMAIGLSEELLLEDEGVEAGLFPALDNDEERW